MKDVCIKGKLQFLDQLTMNIEHRWEYSIFQLSHKISIVGSLSRLLAQSRELIKQVHLIMCASIYLHVTESDGEFEIAQRENIISDRRTINFHN
jgi:hypothetical protein